jgi:hypothetical protein
MPQRVKCLLTVLLAAVLLAGCGGQETSGKQAEEEAQQEETTQEQASVEETTERDIHSEGCPEGQVSNAAGTECRDEEAVKQDHSPRSAVQIAAERAEQMGLTPEQKQNNMAQAASRELGLAQVDPRAIDVYECLVDEGMLETTPAGQEAAMNKLIDEKGVYDMKAMMSDTFKELYGTDCGYMQLGDIRRK